jgi:hypothetical protein
MISKKMHRPGFPTHWPGFAIIHLSKSKSLGLKVYVSINAKRLHESFQ